MPAVEAMTLEVSYESAGVLGDPSVSKTPECSANYDRPQNAIRIARAEQSDLPTPQERLVPACFIFPVDQFESVLENRLGNYRDVVCCRYE